MDLVFVTDKRDAVLLMYAKKRKKKRKEASETSELLIGQKEPVVLPCILSRTLEYCKENIRKYLWGIDCIFASASIS